jgi:hypothetical protein
MACGTGRPPFSIHGNDAETLQERCFGERVEVLLAVVEAEVEVAVA